MRCSPPTSSSCDRSSILQQETRQRNARLTAGLEQDEREKRSVAGDGRWSLVARGRRHAAVADELMKKENRTSVGAAVDSADKMAVASEESSMAMATMGMTEAAARLGRTDSRSAGQHASSAVSLKASAWERCEDETTEATTAATSATIAGRATLTWSSGEEATWKACQNQLDSSCNCSSSGNTLQ
jgi:hypothetical protein